jgi:hypothetical protein
VTDLTRLLEAANRGETHAAAVLLPLVYNDLRKLAAANMAQEKAGTHAGGDGWTDKMSSLFGGQRVARDMPFSRDRIPREDLARLNHSPLSQVFPGRWDGGEGIGRDVAQRYRPIRDLALLGYAECSRGVRRGSKAASGNCSIRSGWTIHTAEERLGELRIARCRDGKNY